MKSIFTSLLKTSVIVTMLLIVLTLIAMAFFFITDTEFKAEFYETKGIKQITLGNLDKAEEQLLEAIRIYQKKGNQHAMGRNYAIMGHIAHSRASRSFFKETLLTKAKDWHHKAYIINTHEKDHISIMENLLQLATIHLSLKQYKEAETYTLELITLTKERDAQHLLLDYYHLLGMIYWSEKEKTKACDTWKEGEHAFITYKMSGETHFLENMESKIALMRTFMTSEGCTI